MKKKTYADAVIQITSMYVVQDCGYKTKCWVYTGATDKDGYGAFIFERSLKAHRFAYQVAKGNPGKKLVCHHCDNPPCIRPSHLFLGTPADNMQDRDNKGRTAKGIHTGVYTHPETRAVGVKNGRAKLSDEDVLYIRTLLTKGLSSPQISSLFNHRISNSLVDHIRQRRLWRHL